MKKFKFSLEKVLEYNTHIQKREKEILAAMRAEYSELERNLNILVMEYELLKQNYLDQSAKGISMTHVAYLLRYIKEIEEKINGLENLMTEKKRLINGQIEKLVEVSKEKMTVEKLKDSKFELYKAEEQKSEETSVEEFISFVNSAPH